MKALLTALHKAQQAFEPLRRNTDNAFTKGKYADLSAVLDAIQQPLLDNGLLVVQLPHTHADDQGRLWVDMVTTLYHVESGESLSNTLPMPAAKADAQAIGSACTYSRRYALMAMFGLAPEDDDGNDASQPPQPAPQRKARPAQRTANGQPQSQESVGDISQPQTVRLNSLGAEVYGVTWPAKRTQLVSAVSRKRTQDAAQLSATEAETLIVGLEAKLAPPPLTDEELANAQEVAF